MVGLNRTTPIGNYKNSTKTGSSHYVDVEIFPAELHWTLNVIMVLISIFGIIGNGMVCYFIAKRRVRRIAFNFLLLNLSIADLCADIFAYLGIFVENQMLRKFSAKTADILCAFTIGYTAFAVVTSVSVLTLTYISLNRYAFTTYPFKTKWFKSKRNTVCFIVFTWLISIGFVSPNTVSFRYDAPNAVCHRVGPENFNELVWTIVGVIIALIIPICTMITTFIATIRQFTKRQIAANINSASHQRKRGSIVLLGLLILSFIICLGPSFVYLTLSISNASLWPAGLEGDFYRMKIIRVVFLFALSNSIADPLIYAYKNPEFHKCFKAAFGDFCCCQSRETNAVLPEIAVI